MASSEAIAATSAPASGWGEWLKDFFVGRSLDTCIESGRDNVLPFRLLAALMVLFGHSYSVLGTAIGMREPLHLIFPRMVIHGTGVSFFFMISGLLITLSWLRRPDLWRFVRARFLRIWPALAVCVTITAFVIGPLVTTWPLRAYFLVGDQYSSGLTYALSNAVLHIKPWLPGVFEHLPTPRYVNGSLWTLPVEATMYLCVASAGVLRLFRFPWLASVGIAAVFSYLVLLPAFLGQPEAWIGYIQSGFFGAGCIACLLRRRVRISTGLMLFFLALCILSRYTTHVMPFTWLAVGYFALWFCYVPKLPAMPRGIDLSYGTYLWAFPTQQLLVMHGVDDPLRLAAYTAPIALALGALSWHFIEKPALRLKDVRWLRRQPAAPAPQSA
jgi:peptidoglycan/LPS O-acetylase OafA/YrhL